MLGRFPPFSSYRGLLKSTGTSLRQHMQRYARVPMYITCDDGLVGAAIMPSFASKPQPRDTQQSLSRNGQGAPVRGCSKPQSTSWFPKANALRRAISLPEVVCCTLARWVGLVSYYVLRFCALTYINWLRNLICSRLRWRPTCTKRRPS